MKRPKCTARILGHRKSRPAEDCPVHGLASGYAPVLSTVSTFPAHPSMEDLPGQARAGSGHTAQHQTVTVEHVEEHVEEHEVTDINDPVLDALIAEGPPENITVEGDPEWLISAIAARREGMTEGAWRAWAAVLPGLDDTVTPSAQESAAPKLPPTTERDVPDPPSSLAADPSAPSEVRETVMEATWESEVTIEVTSKGQSAPGGARRRPAGNDSTVVLNGLTMNPDASPDGRERLREDLIRGELSDEAKDQWLARHFDVDPNDAQAQEMLGSLRQWWLSEDPLPQVKITRNGHPESPSSGSDG